MHQLYVAQLARTAVMNEYKLATAPEVLLFELILAEISITFCIDILNIITGYFGTDDPTSVASGTLITHQMSQLLNLICIRGVIIEDRLKIVHHALFSRMPHLDPSGYGGLSRAALQVCV
jgi:hypothetical protein